MKKNKNTTNNSTAYYAHFQTTEETAPDSLLFKTTIVRPKKSGWYIVKEVNRSSSHSHKMSKFPLYYDATYDEWTRSHNSYYTSPGTKTEDIPTKSWVEGFSTDDINSTETSFTIKDLGF